MLQISPDLALVQTVDFFTPIVDDPYWYGAIAAANALSDVYAMGGVPLTVMNIACFNPDAAPATVWAEVLLGAFDKTTEAGATVVGGHSVEDNEPKFGMSVTGTVNPSRVFANSNAKVGDDIWLSKPLGTGIVTTAAKNDQCPAELLQEATQVMATLNRAAAEHAHAADVRCATDITGFGLAGHLFNVAQASDMRIELVAEALPILSGVLELALRFSPGGSLKNREYLANHIEIQPGVSEALQAILFDPQTSGGLATFSTQPVEGSIWIGRVIEGPVGISVRKN